METKRVELQGGHWAIVEPRTTVADLRAQRIAAHERGFEDTQLDGLMVLRRKIKEWSFGEVTDDAVDALELDDALALLSAINLGSDDGSPNSSSTSPNGTRRSKRTNQQEKSPSSG